MVNAKEWLPLPMPELFTTASCRKDWKRISAKSSVMSVPLPTTLQTELLHGPPTERYEPTLEWNDDWKVGVRWGWELAGMYTT